jgi:hypothetical protein
LKRRPKPSRSFHRTVLFSDLLFCAGMFFSLLCCADIFCPSPLCTALHCTALHCRAAEGNARMLWPASYSVRLQPQQNTSAGDQWYVIRIGSLLVCTTQHSTVLHSAYVTHDQCSAVSLYLCCQTSFFPRTAAPSGALAPFNTVVY